MVDIFTKTQRSNIMRGIKQKDTQPEKIVRSYLHSKGYRFRIHKKGIPGTPDIWLSKYNSAIFVHGCYWHRHLGCRYASTPDDNMSKWQKKFASNVARDLRNRAALANRSIRVLIVWECALKTVDARNLSLPLVERWLNCFYAQNQHCLL